MSCEEFIEFQTQVYWTDDCKFWSLFNILDYFSYIFFSKYVHISTVGIQTILSQYIEYSKYSILNWLSEWVSEWELRMREHFKWNLQYMKRIERGDGKTVEFLLYFYVKKVQKDFIYWHFVYEHFPLSFFLVLVSCSPSPWELRVVVVDRVKKGTSTGSVRIRMRPRQRDEERWIFSSWELKG